MDNLINLFLSADFWFTVIKLTTPILLATMGAHIALRAGVINIGLEGIMLVGAFTGVIVSGKLFLLGVPIPINLLISVIAIIVSGMLGGFFIGFFHLKLNSDIGITGLAYNMVASGLTVFLLFVFVGDKGASYTYKSLAFPTIEIPLIKSIPFIGEIISGQNLLVYIAFLSVIIMTFVMKKTVFGLRIRATGENPKAVQSVGISVKKVQMTALLISGGLAALGGAFLSMGFVEYFVPEMTAGRGFIALTANTMGGTPVGGMLVTLLFGFANALSISLQLFSTIPIQFISMLPYLLTLIALVFFSWRKMKRNVK